MNHPLLCALGVGHPALDKVCTIALEYGLSSKLTGAGGGGCAITLIPYGLSKDIIDEVKSRLQQEGFNCMEVQVGAAGVQIGMEAYP